MKRHIPNIITSLRIILTIPIIISFLFENYTLMIVLTVISALTDCLDGLLARSLDAQTVLGAKLDAISDKLFVLTSSLFVMHFSGIIFIIPLALEGIISIINVKRYFCGENVHSKMTGKVKTWFLFITMILGVSVSILNIPNILLYISMFLTVIAQILTIIDYKKEEIEHKKQLQKLSLV